MNATQLLEHFDRLAEAPDAVNKLRSLILSLAVSGKLIPQLEGEQSAADTLAIARKYLQAQAAVTKKVVWKPSEAVTTEEVPATVPLNWIPARLNDTGFYINGLAFKPSDWKSFGLPIIRIQNLTDSLKEFNFAEGDFPEEVIVRNGDLLVSWSATLEAFLWTRGTGVLNQHIFRVIPVEELTDRRFLHLLLRNAIRQLGASKHAHGLTMTHINRGPFLAHVVLIPPLAEQHRIVAKVNELMALCDQLEAAQQEREHRRDRLAAASLQRLNQPADNTNSEAQREHAHFHLNHLPHLTTRPEHIKVLRQTILNAAVGGRLVAQDQRDESVKELLKRTEAERSELIQAGRIRKEKLISVISEAEQPFVIPESWTWQKIGNVALFTEYGTSQQSSHMDKGVPVLKMGDIQDGKLVLGGQKKVPTTIDDLPALYLEKFDLLYNRTNSAELVGKTGIYLGEDNDYTFASYLIRIRFSKRSMSPPYFNLAMNAPYFRATQITPHLKQQCGQANVNGTILKNMLVPVPPLAEQHRIVAKVDELMALCDQLEAQLTTTQTDSRRLLEAVLEAALAPA